jgi:hypothetical protein
VSDLFYPLFTTSLLQGFNVFPDQLIILSLFTTSLLKEKELTKTCPPRQPSVANPQEGN